MKEIIERKIRELEQTKSEWIERLEYLRLYDDTYVYERIKSARDKIDVLKDLLDEIEVIDYGTEED